MFAVLFLGGLGAPIPEELPILAAGALAHEGYMRWWVALPVCLAGVLSGDSVLYWVGHHWVEGILEWAIVRRVLTPARERVLIDAYRRHAAKTIFTARHVMALRAGAVLEVHPRRRGGRAARRARGLRARLLLHESGRRDPSRRPPCRALAHAARPRRAGRVDRRARVAQEPRRRAGGRRRRAIVGAGGDGDGGAQALARDLQAAGAR